ncbi:MAG: hypothetical protein FWC59_00030, partial [Actinomycetia bacterium]|nr:hypothetical protein [Actinomycetes bacterium]
MARDKSSTEDLPENGRGKHATSEENPNIRVQTLNAHSPASPIDKQARRHGRKRRNLLLWIGSGLIVVALVILGYLIWRQVSASNTYNN